MAASVIDEPFDDAIREVLERLAEGIFPLSRWVAGKVYVPPQEGLPWRPARGQPTLSPKDLGAIVFFGELLRRSAGEETALAVRFRRLTDDALAECPIEGVADWRAARGLSDVAEAKFGVVQSQNMIADASGKPVSRSEFYAPYWLPLRECVQAAAPAGPADWEALAGALATDGSPQWPPDAPKSAAFVRQFARDLLMAMLNQRNPAPTPWRFALLIELGERRRVGNAYSNADARRAVAAFKRRAKTPNPV